MEMKQNQIFFHGTYSNLTQYLFFQKILKQVQTSEMKQNQTFFHGAYSNVTLFFIDHIFHWTFIIGTFQCHCKNERNQVR